MDFAPPPELVPVLEKIERLVAEHVIPAEHVLHGGFDTPASRGVQCAQRSQCYGSSASLLSQFCVD